MDHQEIKIWKRDLGRQSWNVVASLFHAGKNSFRNISPGICDFCSCEVPLDRGSSIDPSSTIISLSTKLAFRSLFGTPLHLLVLSLLPDECATGPWDILAYITTNG